MSEPLPEFIDPELAVLRLNSRAAFAELATAIANLREDCDRIARENLLQGADMNQERANVIQRTN